MAKADPGATAPATPDDIKGALGDLDGAQVLAIMSLRPTIADIEQASVWLDGDPDVFGAGMAVKAWPRKLSQSSRRMRTRNHRVPDNGARGSATRLKRIDPHHQE